MAHVLPGRLLITIMAVAASLAIGSTATAGAKSKIADDLITPGTLVVGTDPNYPPFEFGTPPNLAGFDIDFTSAVARKLGLKVRFVSTSSTTMFTKLKRGRFDLIASAIRVTPERGRVVSFTRPNFDETQSLLVRNGSKIRSPPDLAGKKVGVMTASFGEEFARTGPAPGS